VSILFCEVKNNGLLTYNCTDKKLRNIKICYQWKNVSIGHRCPRFQLTRGITSEWKKQSCQELNFAFFIPDLVFKFKIICFRRTYIIEQKPNAGCMDRCTILIFKN
jgi:hypothetical protein